MTKDTFHKLCEQVLIPMLGNLLFNHLTSVHEDIGAIARELARMGAKLDRLAEAQERQEP